MQIIADLDRPASDAPVGVWLFKMAARVVNHVPIHAVFFDVIRQQSLREVSVLQLLIVGQLHDLGTCLVENLAREGWQSAVAARRHVGLLHDLPCGLFLRSPRLPGHPRDSIADHAGMPFLGFLLPRPFAGRGFDGIDHVVSDVARAREFFSHRVDPHHR